MRVRVHGGGVSGQAGAVRHGVARALVEIDPELRGELKRRGLLTGRSPQRRPGAQEGTQAAPVLEAMRRLQATRTLSSVGRLAHLGLN